MKTSRKAIVLVMAGAMLIAATAGVSAQGFGGRGGSQGTAQGYGYWQWFDYLNGNAYSNQPQMPMQYGNAPFMNGQQRGFNGYQTPAVPGNGPFMNGQQRGFNGNQTPAVPGNGLAMGRKGMMNAQGIGAFQYYQFDKLSAENKDAVVKLVQDTESKILPLQNEVRTERLTLHTLLWSADPDKAKIDDAIAKISDLQKQIQEARADGILAVNKIFEANK